MFKNLVIKGASETKQNPKCIRKFERYNWEFWKIQSTHSAHIRNRWRDERFVAHYALNSWLSVTKSLLTLIRHVIDRRRRSLRIFNGYNFMNNYRGPILFGGLSSLLLKLQVKLLCKWPSSARKEYVLIQGAAWALPY